LLDYSLSWRN